MSFMNIFKKNGEDKETIDENKIFNVILNRTSGGVINENVLEYPERRLSIRVHTEDTPVKGEKKMVQAFFKVNHPFFDVPMCEVVPGYGKSRDEALVSAAENFGATVLVPVMMAMDCTDTDEITAESDGRKHIFRMPCSIISSTIGENNPNKKSLWDIVKEEIPSYLGGKKAYWIKLYASVMGSENVCEVRINDTVYPDITDLLCEYAATWNINGGFHSEKEFVLLIQDDSTFENYPITPDKVMECTYSVLQMFKEHYKEQDVDFIYTEAVKLCGDASIAYELFAFAPEIYASIVLNCRESDSISITAGDRTINLKKSQMRSYGYMEQAVRKYLYSSRPDRDESMKIMCRSSRCGAVRQALLNGAKFENLIIAPIMCNAPKEYVLK